MTQRTDSLVGSGILRRVAAAAFLLVPALGLVVLGPGALARQGERGTLDARAFTPATQAGTAALPRKASTIPGNTGADDVEVRLGTWEATGTLPVGSKPQ